MPNRPVWTQEELVQRVAAALAGPAYPGAPNGRVRDVPDRRTVRWYTTIGLVDRPAGMRGRTALYGPRHLLQIVAIKRLQARGRSIAEIQAELVGATDSTLRRVADVDDEVLSGAAEEGAEAAKPIRSERFWAEPPAAATAAQAGGVAEGVTVRAAVDLPGGALLLLPGSPGRPDEEDLRAIRTAAQPLLDLLAERGLLT
ncbi:MAG: MerR family transcriptional regulator [Mycobacterium sp.]|nr:MerR family transcriptional regulator [Mycobacterium sp.]